MVHALDEIRRCLLPRGILIDLRPVADRWPVEIIRPESHHLAGRLVDLPSGLGDDQAAFQAMGQAEANGWFIREREDYFPLYYYWDTPEEMQEVITTKWEDFVKLDEETINDIRPRWTAGARMRVTLKMLITCWQKC